MLNIVQIGNRPQGSVGSILLAAAGGFEKAGHKVTNIFLKGRPDHQLTKDLTGESICCCDAHEKHGPSGALRQVKREIQKARCDIVIAHRYHPCKIAAQASRGLAINQKIVVFHGLGNLKRLRRKLFARWFLADWVFAGVSEAVAQDIRSSRAVARGRRVHVLSNGLDIEHLETTLLGREEARKHLGLPPDAFVFGNIGRLSDSKNQDVLIRAYALMAEKLTASRLVIIGAGSQKDALQSRADALGLQDRVLFTGHLPNARHYLKAFDVFVFPSRSEAFGLALLEAMAAGVPAIIADVGGIAELVGPYTFRINPDDVQTLASQMMNLAQTSADERGKIGRELATRAMAYDIQRLEASYLKIVSLPS